ncbi:FAD-binding oxidoreductase [Thiolapillus sp.]
MNEQASPLSPAQLKALEQIFPGEDLLTHPADTLAYSYDNSQRQSLPAAVVFARDEEQVQTLLALCNDWQLPLACRGKGTGTAGASIPPAGGLALSLERMNRILEIDPDNRLARVQPGVTNRQLQQAVARHGFFWPPDPTSAAVCTIGGNLACNAAGPRAVKYGTCRENTLGLHAVSASGQLLRTGVRTTKGVVGYDLTRLIIGSEGTLAVITEATLKLSPLPQARRTLQALYRDVGSAATAVSAIMARPITPSALEFMDARALAMVKDHADPGIAPDAGALLMIELEESEAAIDDAAAQVAATADIPGCLGVETATSQEQVQTLWRTRKALSPALRNVAPKKINEDVVVPVSRIPELIGGLEALARRHGITIVNFGHAGNGNIHVNLLIDPDDPVQMKAADACLGQVFDLVLGLGGTLSGEHGIGLVKRDFVSREIDDPTLSLMQQLKAVFDPRGILNPGKTLP